MPEERERRPTDETSDATTGYALPTPRPFVRPTRSKATPMNLEECVIIRWYVYEMTINEEEMLT